MKIFFSQFHSRAHYTSLAEHCGDGGSVARSGSSAPMGSDLHI